MHVLEKVWSGQDVDTRIILTDTGMQVEILQKAESFTVEPVVGDVTRVGIAITNSETGGPLPVAKGYSLRLKCTNGATVRIEDKDEERRGVGRYSGDWRCSMERRFDRFTNDLHTLMQTMQLKCAALQSAYRHMGEARLDDKQFFSWYRKALYLSRDMTDSSAETDGMFGVEPKARQEIINREQERLRELRKEKAPVIAPPQSTSLSAWEVFNGITQAARDELRYHRRAGLENLASDIVSAFMPSLN